MRHDAGTPGTTLRAVDVLACFACGCVAYALSVHAGRIGFMPLDQSIVFDGGWRILSGQVPGRDFMTPAGLTPIALQAVVFAIAGTSWSAYVAHAGLVNAAGAMVMYAFLRRAGLGVVSGAACGLATGAWLYPAMGTPYMDQHSLFFAAAAVLACWHAATNERRWWWVVAGIAAALAVLSKQVPALLILPLGGTGLFLGSRRRVAAGLAVSAVTGLAVLGLVVGSLVGFGARTSDIIESAWRLPLEVGQARRHSVGALIPFAIAAIEKLMRFGYWFAFLLAGCTAAALAWRAVGRRARGNAGVREGLVWSASGLGIVVTTLLSCSLTNNDPSLLFGLLPLALALMLLGLRRITVGRDQPPPGRIVTVAVKTITAASSAVLLLDAATGYTTLGLGRRSHDMNVTAAMRSAPWYAPRLRAAGFSVWAAPAVYTSAAQSLESLLEWLDRTPGNFVLLGDESIVYGLTARPSPSPLLWYHPAITFRLSGPAVNRLERQFDEALVRYSVRWVVIPQNPSWTGWNEATLPGLAARLANRPCESVGTYRVCDIAAR